MLEEWTKLLSGARRLPVEEGEGLELRLLSAAEVLEARREAESLQAGEKERALCANACLLARALERGGERVFESGQQVLQTLRVEEIAPLARQWGEWNRRENPGPAAPREEVARIKKAWSTRLMAALRGACSGRLGPFPRRPGPGR